MSDQELLLKMVKTLREDIKRNIDFIIELQLDNQKIREALKKLYQEKHKKEVLFDKLIKELKPLLERSE